MATKTQKTTTTRSAAAATATTKTTTTKNKRKAHSKNCQEMDIRKIENLQLKPKELKHFRIFSFQMRAANG